MRIHIKLAKFDLKKEIRNMRNSGYLKAIGENIRKIRLEKSLSLRALSALCNTIDHKDITRIEKGAVNITVLTLLQLAEALEVQPGKIIDFKSEL